VAATCISQSGSGDQPLFLAAAAEAARAREMSNLLGLDYGSEEDASPASHPPPPSATVPLAVVEYHADDAADPVAEDKKRRAAASLGLAEEDDTLEHPSEAAKPTGVGASVATVTREVKKPASGDGSSSSSSAAFVVPGSPPGDADPKLLEKYQRHVASVREGHSVNHFIRHQKRYRNPCLLEQLVKYLNVPECGSNYPPHLYDPNAFGAHQYYDKLEEARKEWESRQARKPGERVDFRSAGAAAPPPPVPAAAASSSGAAAPQPNAPPAAAEPPPKRKSKWDTGGSEAKVPRGP